MRYLINDQWEFAKLPFGSTIEDFQKAEKTRVSLPHDWLIGQDDLYETADAWYRRMIHTDAKPQEKVMVHFDGVYMDCDIFLNGKIVKSHAYGYTAFRADLSGAVEQGDNELLVHIRHQSPNSRWYSGSGIYRDVHLEIYPRDHVVPDSMYITDCGDAGTRKVTIEAETAGNDEISFRAMIFSPDGKAIREGTVLSENHHIFLTVEVENAELWEPDHPALYRLEWEYGEEQGIKRIGFRDLEFNPDCGFSINGHRLKMKGVCLHHDLGALGAAFHEKAARRQLELMRGMGVNALRTSHNPPAEKMLDLCDEMGILVIDEAFDMWERCKTTYDYARFFDACEEEDVALWIRRDRNHPSVIMWSIGNEIYDMHADLRGTEVTRMLTEQVHRHDPKHHAEVTFGCNYMPWEGGQRCAEVVKVPGYNYGEKYYEEHHRKHPDWVIYGSETASVLASRGIYHFPISESIMSELDLQCSALGNSNTSWGAQNLEQMIVEDLQTPFSMGQFIWSGIDYIGEPTPYHTRNCYFGQADTACFPKDSYYLFRSLWQDEPMIHIGVIWNWNPGQMIDVPVMTNCAQAELFLNGESLGRKNVNLNHPKACKPVWTIPYQDGILTAVGYDREGMIAAEDTKRSFGNSIRLCLRAEENTLKSDGHDLAFIEISAEDDEGRPVENARDQVKITVTGGGVLVGTDNGDSSDPDSYKSDTRHLFSGKLLAIIASNGLAEDTVIVAESGTCEGAKLILKTVFGKIEQGIGSFQPVPVSGKPLTRKPVRQIRLIPEDDTIISPEHPKAVFRYEILPENHQPAFLQWQVTNRLGIAAPFVQCTDNIGSIHVTAEGDGEFYLRALYGNRTDHPEMISQIEIRVLGMGIPALNPYQFISAGLFDLHEGEIGTGNEKGIAFARDGASMVGFSRVDFGNTGSDELILPVFALDGKPYDIELFRGIPGRDGHLVSTLRYQKPSIWNVYQEEVFHLPERLRGIQTICFRMRDKVHLKGFCFRKTLRTEQWLNAAEADEIYGDSFSREEKAVTGIGNNVTLVYRDMEFEKDGEALLTLEGKTPLEKNTISIRITSETGETTTELAEFRGNGGARQQFRLRVPAGNCTVSFVFLPGCQFDFAGFQFRRTEE